MDRNFFVAIALAFLVLVLYQSIFIGPKHTQALKSSQVSATVKDADKSDTVMSLSLETHQKSTNQDIKPEITTIKSTNSTYLFSNVGGALYKVEFNGNDKVLPLDKMLTVKGFEDVSFNVLSRTEDGIIYGYEDPNTKITKSFTIKNNSLEANIDVANIGKSSRVEEIEINTLNIDGSQINTSNNRASVLYEFSILENNKIKRTGNAYKFNPKNSKTVNNSIEWVGYRTHYHAFIIKPEFETKAYQNQVVSDNKFTFSIKPKQDTLSSGQTAHYAFTIVAGDQNIEGLKKYGKKFEKIVAFNYWWIFNICAIASYYVIEFLHMVCHSWGISILLFSLVVYGLTYPMTIKSMASMKKMQLVQPKVQALQKRYKEDPQKLNAEMIELYRREGVNPLGGCLPMLLQMPLLVAVYQVLWRAYYFQGQSFLWIKNLSEPDRLFILPFDLPLLGNEFNILPIAVGIAMFFQQQASSKNMVVADEQQAMQQKMFKWLIPGMMFFAFYHMSSSWLLYFMVFSGLSAWTQWKIANPGNSQAK